MGYHSRRLHVTVARYHSVALGRREPAESSCSLAVARRSSRLRGRDTGHRRGSTSSSLARSGSAGRKSCGQRCEERRGEVRTGSRSGTSSPTSAAASRSWTSSLPRTRGGWSQPWLRKTHRARRRSGAERKGRGEEASGGRVGRRRWGATALPSHTLLHGLCGRGGGCGGGFSLFFL